MMWTKAAAADLASGIQHIEGCSLAFTEVGAKHKLVRSLMAPVVHDERLRSDPLD